MQRAKGKPGRLSKAAALVHELNSTLKPERAISLGGDPKFAVIRIPTGSHVLDRITGGGFALGRHVELYGDESAGKSYVQYVCMALSQERGNLCALIDPEHYFEAERFAFLGGKPDELILEQPANAEEAVATMMMLAKHASKHQIEIISIDSIAALLPTEELSKDPREEDRIAPQARMMSRALRRLTAVTDKALFLWTNQERTNVGVAYGNPRTTPGGRAMRYYATTRVEMRRGQIVKRKREVARNNKLVSREIPVGRWIQCRVEKDKSTRPYREGNFFFDGETGAIDEASELVQLGLEDGIITSEGRSLAFEDLDGKMWRYPERQFHDHIRKNDDLRAEILGEVQDNTQRMSVYGET
jgi:recombination protein RecA